MIRKHSSSSRRSGVVLLVVITLLALFAAMGLSFVFYAEGEALSAEISSAAENKNKVDLDPELLCSYFHGLFLYGVPSHFSSNGTVPSGLYSTMRGQGLAENAYGFTSNFSAGNPNPNTTPFNGVEKANFPAPVLPTNWQFAALTTPPGQLTYADIVNFTYHPSDGFIIDPQRMSVRTPLPGGNWASLMSQPLAGPYVGWNVPYTYSDMNNPYLGTMNASGELLAPSFFRTYANPKAPNLFLPMDPQHPLYGNWKLTDPWWKYLTARPFPSLHPYFPLGQLNNGGPGGGGDVKNLDFGPGLKNPSGGYYPNDSPWMDMGFPVIIGPDGRKYKPLFAPLIISLDGKINVHASGNISSTSGAIPTHASNSGLGPWEISLTPFLLPAEYPQMFFGANGTAGKYGSLPNSIPGVAGPTTATLINSKAPPYQGPLDRNSVTTLGAQTTKMMLPGEASNANPSYFAFPNFSNFPPAGSAFGWGNFGDTTQPLGQSASSAGELLKHPASYNTFNPPLVGATSTNRAFLDSDLEALIRYRGTGSSALSSDLLRLLYNSLNDPTGHNRMSLTTRSFSLGLPTASPWLGLPGQPLLSALPGNFQLPLGPAINPGSAASPTGTASYPQGAPVPFPTPVPGNAPPAWGEFAPGTWNYNPSILQRVNLNRPLKPYPTPNTTTIPIGVIDPTNYGLFAQAVQDRQALAQQIFNVFTQVTMGGPPNLPNVATAYPILPGDARYAGYQSLIWLAQLAVNIVDFIDSDNYITPFNWNPFDATNGWVYGTEQPRLLINEVYAEIVNAPGDPVPPGMVALLNYNVNAWVELHNPLQADPSIVDIVSQNAGYPSAALAGQGVVRLEMPGPTGTPLYQIYQVIVTNQPTSSLFLNPQLGVPTAPAPPMLPGVVGAGLPGSTPYSPTPNPAFQTVAPAPANTSYYRGPEGGNSGFYVIGPQGVGAQNPFPAAGGGKLVPTLQANMTFPVANGIGAIPNANFFLTRLACPDLPPQINATLPMYNPYVTVDYFTLNPPQPTPIPPQINDARAFAPNMVAQVPAPNRFSYGRAQPFAAAKALQQKPNPAHNTSPQHTFFRHNAEQPKVSAATPLLTSTTLAIPFNWLVHLDRQVTSPLELLHVSAYPPNQLTQQFMYASPPFAPTYGHTSMPAWFDSSARIHRALEFFDAGIRATAIDPYGQVIPLTGRIPGKININEIWDKKQLRALCDAQTQTGSVLSTFTQAQVDLIFASIMSSRSPTGMPSAFDRPFKGMAAGNVAAGNGIEDTFLRPNTPGAPVNINDPVSSLSAPASARLLAIPGQTVTMNVGGVPTIMPPQSNYVKMELMNKIFNNITCQSNVFAVWLTVGFFDVTDGPITTAASATPPGVASSITVQAATGLQYLPPVLPATSGTLTGMQLGVPWAIQKGCGIWVDNEPVAVKNVSTASPTGPYTITFWKPFANTHGAGSVVSMKGVLGGEVGLSEGRNVRHRMFSIVDRSALSIPSQLTQVPGAVLQHSAHPLPATVTPSLIVLPQGQVGVAYPSTGNPAPANPAATFFIPGGPFTIMPHLNVGGTGLNATIANGANSSTVTFSGVPSVTTPVTYFFIRFHPISGGPVIKQYFKISIPQSTVVAVSQLSGVATVSFPAQAATAVGPSMTTSYSWKIQPGMNLVISGYDANFPLLPTPTPIQETITVQAPQLGDPPGAFRATFANAYWPNATLYLSGQAGTVPGSILGNPGPQQRFDHRQNTALVPHYSIIQ